MHDPSSGAEELGYFYDTIHGRIALGDLPRKFLPALKAALSSVTLARLKGISQLGHTSVSFFSATHTRFSHAVGTMLVMDKLFRHVVVQKGGLPKTLNTDIKQRFPTKLGRFKDVREMLHCHLLLVALYQDAGELPFQKVTSLYFKPAKEERNHLALTFQGADVQHWTGKQVFSVLALLKDLNDPALAGGFKGYDHNLLVYLMTTRAATEQRPLAAVLQMVDGFAIDADRLDYVYRDALATIGSLSGPSAVLESIVGYKPQSVIVNDSRPVTDFLSTRMRLFTFVYNSADVRFRQALLKTFLEGYWDSCEATAAFDGQHLKPELTYDAFKDLDDNSLMERIEKLKGVRVEGYRNHARELLLRGIPDYEFQILERPGPDDKSRKLNRLPPDLFFDLLGDHGHHHMYRPQSVFVTQGLTAGIDQTLPLEKCAGAFSPLFAGENVPTLVPRGFYVFLPRDENKRRQSAYRDVDAAIKSRVIFQQAQWEEAWRSLHGLPLDTRKLGFEGPAISISFCGEDYPTVAAIVCELFRRERQYWLFLDKLELEGIGRPVEENSQRLIDEAESVLAVCSISYLRKYFEDSYVSIEIRAMNRRASTIPIIPVGVDARDDLERVNQWKWHFMNEAWKKKNMSLSNPAPLRSAGVEVMQKTIDAVLREIDGLKAK